MSFCASQVFVVQIRRRHKSLDNEVNYAAQPTGKRLLPQTTLHGTNANDAEYAELITVVYVVGTWGVKMKKMVLGMVLAFTCYASQASTEADVAATFKNYWGNFSCGKYRQAAQLILPSDLRGTREHVLPVMISALDSKSAAGSKAAATFFGVAKKKPQDFDEVDVYAGLVGLIGADAETLKILCAGKVNAVKVAMKNKEHAVVSYSIRLTSGEVVEGDPEALVKDGGKWYLKMGLSPQDAATTLKELYKW